MVTSTLLWGSGDVIAQQIDMQMSAKRLQLMGISEQAGGVSEDCENTGLSSSREAAADVATVEALVEGLDRRRVLTTSLFGAGFVGPAGHYWYSGLEGFVKNRMRLRPASFQFVGAKLFFDTFIFGPVHLGAFFTYTGLVSGHSMQQVTKDLARDFVPAFVTEATVWPVIQTINFKLVPVQHQLLFVNFFCLLDSAWLSWLKYQRDAPWKTLLNDTILGRRPDS